MRIRLIITEDCKQKCKGCCNKSYDMEKIPRVTIEEIRKAEQIILTGGEPMLDPWSIIGIIRQIKQLTPAPIVMYTADTKNYPIMLFKIINILDGVTITLHSKNDIEPFISLANKMAKFKHNKTLRLNVFSHVARAADLMIDYKHLVNWSAKEVKWIKNCPLPKGEILRKY